MFVLALDSGEAQDSSIHGHGQMVLDNVDITNREFKAQNQELTKSLFSQNLSFISSNKKHARGINHIKEARIVKWRQFVHRQEKPLEMESLKLLSHL